MKILIVHNFYKIPGGEDVVFRNETKLLRDHGHEVETLSFSNDDIDSGIKAAFFGFLSYYNLDSARKLEARIQKFRPDIIHVHNTFLIASPSIFFVAKKYKIPVVKTLHNYRLICPSTVLLHNDEVYENSIHKIFPLDAIMKGVYKGSRVQTAILAGMTGFHKLIGTWKNKVERYIVLTEFSKRKFLDSSLKVSSKKYVLKPNFIFDEGYEMNKEDYFLYVGRLSIEKGIDTIIEAFRGSDRHIRIIGDGDLRSKVEKAARNNSNIHYLGSKPHNEVFDSLKKAKALIFASNWYETFGLTIIEAFSTATPVIISNMGGHREFVLDCENGIRFETNDPTDLRQKLSMLDDVKFHRKLCENARKSYEEHYTPEKNYKTLISIYEDAIRSKKVLD
jgi:glycosyltransferase involved in cell wall biosynthesis